MIIDGDDAAIGPCKPQPPVFLEAENARLMANTEVAGAAAITPDILARAASRKSGTFLLTDSTWKVEMAILDLLTQERDATRLQQTMNQMFPSATKAVSAELVAQQLHASMATDLYNMSPRGAPGTSQECPADCGCPCA